MHEKNKNQESANEAFKNRVKEMKRAAIQENIEKAKESGTKLTQNIKKDGTLYKTNTTPLAGGKVRKPSDKEKMNAMNTVLRE